MASGVAAHLLLILAKLRYPPDVNAQNSNNRSCIASFAFSIPGQSTGCAWYFYVSTLKRNRR
jgi:hypothetical protein